MNCAQFQKELDLLIGRGDFRLSSKLDEHLRACDSCRGYHFEMSGLMATLNRQKFQVRPGELDDITFEKMLSAEVTSKKRVIAFEKIQAGLGRWVSPGSRRVWVPAVAAVVIAGLVLVPGIIDKSDDSYTPDESSVYMVPADDYSAVESIDDLVLIVEALVDDSTEFDLAAEELIMDTDYNDIIDYLSEEELNVLYLRIETINGSSG